MAGEEWRTGLRLGSLRKRVVEMTQPSSRACFVRRQSEPFFVLLPVEAVTRSKACVDLLDSMKEEGGQGKKVLETYRVHTEVVSNAVLPATVSTVSSLLTVLTDPRVHIFQRHGVVRYIPEAAIEKLCIARINRLRVSGLARFILLRDGVRIVHEVSGALTRATAR
jgi:hypothetical protein